MSYFLIKNKNNKGFTLIELLVVIAIIGVLSSVVLASLNSARLKARNAQRLSDMNQLVRAIEMYRNDYGVYPPCGGGSSGCSTTFGVGSNLMTLNLVPTYISNISNDPTNINGQYGYYYVRGYKPTSANSWVATGSDQNFMVATRLEDSSKPIFSGWGNSNLNVLIGQ